MVSKNQIKDIVKLHQKKYRISNQRFFVEGIKATKELLDSRFELVHLYTTQDDFEFVLETKKTGISADVLKQISALATPNSCLAIFKIPQEEKIVPSGLLIVLDGIRDPGNMGAIVRLCDWFGIEQIVCSMETVDLFNPKVIQATMGSIARVKVNYTDLESFIAEVNLPVFGTFMEGDSIYKTLLPKEAVIVMGNEGKGISENLEKLIQNRLSIPRFGRLQQTESLNVATATAVVLSEFKRFS